MYNLSLGKIIKGLTFNRIRNFLTRRQVISIIMILVAVLWCLGAIKRNQHDVAITMAFIGGLTLGHLLEYRMFKRAMIAWTHTRRAVVRYHRWHDSDGKWWNGQIEIINALHITHCDEQYTTIMYLLSQLKEQNQTIFELRVQLIERDYEQATTDG